MGAVLVAHPVRKGSCAAAVVVLGNLSMRLIKEGNCAISDGIQDNNNRRYDANNMLPW